MIKKSSISPVSPYMYGTNNKRYDMNNMNPETRSNKGLNNKTLFNSYTNNGYSDVRYFSGVDAEIYFGDVYVDEVVDITFQLQQNTLPIFGYNSFVFDEVSQGSRLIQGRFTINFTKSSYMYDVLNALNNISSASNISANVQNDGSLTTESKEAEATTNTKISIQTRKAMWNKGFNIVVSYGDANQNAAVYGSTLIYLDEVYITGCQQQFGMDGNPIFETYNFIARDIEFGPKTPAVKQELSKRNVKVDSVFDFEDISYNELIMPDTGRAIGTFSIKYKALAEITKIGIVPIIPTMENKAVTYLEGDKSVNNIHKVVNYTVPSEWRDSIKNYCLYNPNLNKPRVDPSNIEVMMVYYYKNNSGAITGPVNIKVNDGNPKARLLNVYSNL